MLAVFSWWATAPLTTALTANPYGLRSLGTISGISLDFHQLGGFSSVLLAGFLYDSAVPVEEQRGPAMKGLCHPRPDLLAPDGVVFQEAGNVYTHNTILTRLGDSCTRGFVLSNC